MRNLEISKKQFFERGWCRFDYDEALANWVEAVLPYARETVSEKANAQWLRCGGAWFAGVNVLPNRTDGSVPGSPPLQGAVIDFIRRNFKPDPLVWDAAQVSVCYPGYPQRMDSETEKAFLFRRDRDAAHVDGFLREGPEKRRHLRECHGFVLGIPMVEFDEMASPLMVWEGSHELVRAAMAERFKGLEASSWGDEDITECYHKVRREIFEQCKRVPVTAKPGEAYLVHRLALHGISPWQPGAKAGVDGRMICYFRPDIGDVGSWLLDP
jgi:hypothetical protein